MNKSANPSVRSSWLPPLRLVFLMWLFFAIETFFLVDLGFLGIYPRNTEGLIGLLTAPLIHGNLNHLLSNTFPLLFLGGVLYMFYNQVANQVFLQCYLITNFFVWLLARPFYHIGASGVVYALAAFLIAIGLFRKDFKSLFIAVAIIFLYGGLIYGVLPGNQGISWESHLFGAIVGVGSAWGIFKSYQKRN